MTTAAITSSNPAPAASLLDRFQAMPRVMRWAALAAIGLALFAIWDNFIQPMTDDLNKSSEQIVSDVSDIRKSQADLDQLKAMKDTVTSLGPVEAPSSTAESDHVVSDFINATLQKNNATNINSGLQGRGVLQKGSLVGVVRADRRVELLSFELKFDATPQAAVAILAEFESSPDIESVSSVRLIRDAGGKVKVHMTVEAWNIASEGPAKGAST